MSKSVDTDFPPQQISVPAAVSYSWTDDSTLKLTARFVEESLGDQVITFKFSETGGVVRVAIEQNTPSIMRRGTGAPTGVQLRGTMVDIK
jgi:hypothetical protein